MIHAWLVPLAAGLTAGIIWWCSRKQVAAQRTVTVPPLWIAYARRLVYAAAVLWATGVYLYATYTVPTVSGSLAMLTRLFGFSALAAVFITLTPGLLQTYFPNWFPNPWLIRSRRAMGVSSFIFVLLHATIAFFQNLTGSLTAVFFLSAQHQVALLASGTAFVIYTALLLTSTDWAMRKLGRVWKRLHRLIYIAALGSVFHAFLIGSHFTNGTSPIPLFVNYTALLYVLLEAGAVMKRRWAAGSAVFRSSRVLLGGLACMVLVAVGLSSWSVSYAYDPHARHRRGYSQDYAVTVAVSPAEITPGIPLQIQLTVSDKRTQKPVEKFRIIQEKLMHVIVTSKDLTYYDHIHPEYQGNGVFTVTTTFPREGTYQLFTEYSPPDFAENVSVISLSTRNAPAAETASLKPGPAEGVFSSRYHVSVTPAGPFRKNQTVDFTYTLTDTTTGRAVDTLEPYLGAFGHLAMIAEDGSTYVHVHPIDIPAVGQTQGGPTVRFSTYFPKSGRYKLFAQFQHEGALFVTDFVVEAK